MTPEEMADLHREGFAVPRPWTAAEFAALLDQPGVALLTAPGGFALCRVVADEAELLTITVAPTERRKGRGTTLMARLLNRARADRALTCFLEVAADNTPARALYDGCGFRVAGRRRGYYRDAPGGAVDALIMVRDLTAPGHGAAKPAGSVVT